jgi:hypothetical protein
MEGLAMPTNATRKPRYKRKRKCIDWFYDDLTLVLREACPLAYAVVRRRGRDYGPLGEALWLQLGLMMPHLTRAVLGKAYSLRDIENHIWETQRRNPTMRGFSSLLGRADSLVRYNETSPMTARVKEAWRQLSHN